MTSNSISGPVHGTVVQAGRVDHLEVVVDTGVPHMLRPRQLPARRPLVDRAEQLCLVRQVALDASDQTHVAVLTGIGGVGKSALAVEIGHLLADHFPDGQLHADLGAHCPTGPASPADLLETVLHGLGVPPRNIPRADAARLAMYRTLTAGRRLLIILDDAGTSDQVRPLLPPSPHSCVLVTSRKLLPELVVNGAIHVAVGALSPLHAVDLLDALLRKTSTGTERAAAEHISELCDGLPLALVLAAGQVATRPSESLSALATRLSAGRGALSLTLGSLSLKEVLSMSYTQLRPSVAEVYHVAGLHRGPFTIDVVAAALDWSPEDAATAVRELIDANLVHEVDTGSDVGLHLLSVDNVVQHHAVDTARSKLAIARQDALLCGMLAHYRDRCIAADRILRPTQYKISALYGTVPQPFPNRAEAVNWFRPHRAVIVHLFRTADERTLSDSIACDLAEPLWTLLHQDGHHDQVIDTQQWGAQAARRLRSPFEAVALVRKAHAHKLTGRPDEAVTWCSAALDLVDKNQRQWSAHSEWLKSIALHGRGRAFAVQGDWDRALADSQASLDIERHRALDDPSLTGYAVALRLRDLAWVHAQMGGVDAALTLLDEAEDLTRAVATATGDYTGIARTLYKKGQIRLLLGDAAAARDAFADAEPLLLDLDALRWLIELYALWSDADLRAHDRTAALGHLGKARAAAMRDGDFQHAEALAERIAEIVRTHDRPNDPPAKANDQSQ